MASIQQQPPTSSMSTIPSLNAVNVTRELENVIAQQSVLRDQIRQSEQNLTAQHGVSDSNSGHSIRMANSFMGHSIHKHLFVGIDAAAAKANRRGGRESTMGNGSQASGREWSPGR